MAAGRGPAAPPGASYLISGRSARQTRGLGHHDAPNFAEEDAVASVVMHFDAFGRKPSSYEYHFWSSIAARGSVRAAAEADTKARRIRDSNHGSLSAGETIFALALVEPLEEIKVRVGGH
jgi:hypothetical protein